MVTVSVGFTAEQIREFVHEYEVQPFGGKGVWLAARGVSYDRLRRWQSAVFEGDVERELEAVNNSLGKAIGLLHQMSEQEPGQTPDPSGPPAS